MIIPSSKKTEGYLPALMFALGFRLLLTLYWLTRFGGYWSEGDTSRTTPTIQAILQTGEIVPENQRVYPLGFLYQVFGAVYALFTGLSIQDIQQWLLPFAGILITLIAFTFYLRIFKNPTAAGIAVSLLNLQGDFILTTMRGSHEKLDYLLIFVSLLILVLSVQWFDSLRERVALAIMYYLAILAENTSNAFFASTFTINLILAFCIWMIIARYTRNKVTGISWLLYVAIVSIVFTFLVVFIWYPPALAVVLTADNLTQRIILFLFSPVETPSGLLDQVNASWIFPYAWLWLRAFDIILFMLAGIGWLLLVARARNDRENNTLSPITNNYFWLIILLPAFAFQNFLLIFSDLTGSIGQINNLQIRLIPLTVFAAAPVAVYAIYSLMGWLHSRISSYWLISITLSVVALFSLFLGVIKGTSEPLLSNVFLFYSPAEYAGVGWMDNYMPMVAPDAKAQLPLIWTGPDERIRNLWLSQFWDSKLNFIPVTTDINEHFSYVFFSPVNRLSAERLDVSLPDIRNYGVIYSNGDVEIYYRPLGAD
jgi:hypothetical protein